MIRHLLGLEYEITAAKELIGDEDKKIIIINFIRSYRK